MDEQPNAVGIYALIGAVTVQATLDFSMQAHDKAYKRNTMQLRYSARRWLLDMGLLDQAGQIANAHRES